MSEKLREKEYIFLTDLSIPRDPPITKAMELTPEVNKPSSLDARPSLVSLAPSISSVQR